MSSYSKEEQDAIQEDYKRLALLWAAYKTEHQNGTNPEPLHHAPALRYFHQYMIEHTDLDQYASLGDFVDFMAGHVFQFAQYCMMRGLLYANMIPCNHADIDDDDIKNFFEKYGGGDSVSNPPS